ncbi:MAG TPA: hypothetical protein ENJ53_03005 [Phaeodactylibacter sp.]|nr:hypothetical protein [Phaeodactylibacter sp.]
MKNNIFFLLFFLVSCGGGPTTTANNSFAKTLSEEQIIDRTMNDFVANATTQDEIDRNLILNYIIDNKLDMQSTPDGIYYQITKEGTGSHPTIQDVIVTNYHGTFLDGKVFDSTRGKKKPFTHPLSRMNDGWKKVLPLMKTGSTGIFIIPSRFCYGEQGFGELIPPNTILKFEIELLGIKERRK